MARTKAAPRKLQGAAAVKTARRSGFSLATLKKRIESKTAVKTEAPKQKHGLARWRGAGREYATQPYLHVRRIRQALKRQRAESRRTDSSISNAAARRTVERCLIEEGYHKIRVSTAFVESLHQKVEDDINHILADAVREMESQKVTNKKGEIIPRHTVLMGRHVYNAFYTWSQYNNPDAWTFFKDKAKVHCPFLVSPFERQNDYDVQKFNRH